MEDDETMGYSIFLTSKIFLRFCLIPKSQAQVDLYKSQEINSINTPNVFYRLLHLTAAVPKSTVKCIITSPHVAKLGLIVIATA